ncbi:MAG: squalene cyclase [Actinomycetota bacterium]|nr:squalene cyclase [Actinomycetota bacterium]
MTLDPELRDWMLDTDPALRWQVERDLLNAPSEVWRATRARVATEGMGAELLSHQDLDGQWAGGAYFPKDFDFASTEPGQPWTATTWSLNALREWGVDAAALAGTAEKLDANSRWEYDDLPYWGGEVDACINGFTLANGAWLGADVSDLAEWFVAHQLTDGGWNCEWVEGSTRSSFHSTLNALTGILSYEIATGGGDELRAARHRAEEYLLARQLMRRLSTGEQHDWVTWIAYPFRWRFNVLTATDYFRAASLHDGTMPDSRLTEAIEAVRAPRQPDGRWLQGPPHPGRAWYEVDVLEGQPSPWLTFFGTRVLDWWDASKKHHSETSIGTHGETVKYS